MKRPARPSAYAERHDKASRASFRDFTGDPDVPAPRRHPCRWCSGPGLACPRGPGGPWRPPAKATSNIKQHPTACRARNVLSSGNIWGDESGMKVGWSRRRQTPKKPNGRRALRPSLRTSPSEGSRPADLAELETHDCQTPLHRPNRAGAASRASHPVPFFLLLPESADEGRTNPKQPVHRKGLHPGVTNGVLKEPQDLSWQPGSFLT